MPISTASRSPPSDDPKETDVTEPLTDETFTAGVPLERLRAIQAAGGLAKLLWAFDGLHSACNIALPFLWNAPLDGAIEAFEQVRFRRNAAESFRAKEQS
jgi:hypothetical protein